MNVRQLREATAGFWLSGVSIGVIVGAFISYFDGAPDLFLLTMVSIGMTVIGTIVFLAAAQDFREGIKENKISWSDLKKYMLDPKEELKKFRGPHGFKSKFFRFIK